MDSSKVSCMVGLVCLLSILVGYASAFPSNRIMGLKVNSRNHHDLRIVVEVDKNWFKMGEPNKPRLLSKGQVPKQQLVSPQKNYLKGVLGTTSLSILLTLVLGALFSIDVVRLSSFFMMDFTLAAAICVFAFPMFGKNKSIDSLVPIAFKLNNCSNLTLV